MAVWKKFERTAEIFTGAAGESAEEIPYTTPLGVGRDFSATSAARPGGALIRVPKEVAS